MTILLTGASGFIGKAILETAMRRNLKMRPVYRSPESAAGKANVVLVPDLREEVDWSEALQDVEAVIHTAARAHIMVDDTKDPLAEYRWVNVHATTQLARQAAAHGVKRFIFISSIKVNGDETTAGCPFTADDPPAPKDAYGLSKAEAENLLMQIAQETGMEITIIRAPLVYGPGVKGNFKMLVNWVHRGLPLPLGCLDSNRRSFVALENLVELILICLTHSNAKNQIFLISDGEDLSTTELLWRISNAMNRSPRLICIPSWIISFIALLVGKKDITDRLIGSLQVDIRKTCQMLNWRPPLGVDKGLLKCVR
jgi:nucleoside-diphosphate-sugar epimerase